MQLQWHKLWISRLYDIIIKNALISNDVIYFSFHQLQKKQLRKFSSASKITINKYRYVIVAPREIKGTRICMVRTLSNENVYRQGK